MKSLELIMSNEWFSAIYWNSFLFGIFMIKKWVEFSLTSFGTLKCDCVIKTIQMFNFCLYLTIHLLLNLVSCY